MRNPISTGFFPSPQMSPTPFNFWLIFEGKEVRTILSTQRIRKRKLRTMLCFMIKGRLFYSDRSYKPWPKYIYENDSTCKPPWENIWGLKWARMILALPIINFQQLIYKHTSSYPCAFCVKVFGIQTSILPTNSVLPVCCRLLSTHIREG